MSRLGSVSRRTIGPSPPAFGRHPRGARDARSPACHADCNTRKHHILHVKFADTPHEANNTPGNAPLRMGNVRSHTRWLENYRCLVAYTKENGHSLVPRSYVTPDGFKLGIWVADQRRRRHLHSESEEASLERLRGWVWDASNWQSIRA